MPEYLAPGVYVEEVSFRAKSIEGVSTTTTGFVGPTRYGPLRDPLDVITSLHEFEAVYGDRQKLVFGDAGEFDNYMWHAARAFFEEGGKRLYVKRVFAGDGLDAHASATVPASNPANAITVAARYPGAAGGLRVRFTVAAGQNVLAPQDGEPRVRGVSDHDVVLFVRAGSPVERALLTAESHFDTQTGATTWRFNPAAGPPGSPPSPLELADLDLTTDTIQIVTVSVSVSADEPGALPQVWAGLPLDPAHQLGGAPDAVSAVFGVDSNEARGMPITIDVGTNTTGLAVLDALDDATTGSALLTALEDPTSSVDQRSVDTLLTNGSDGDRPKAGDYEGAEEADDTKTGLVAFEDIDDVSIIAAPGSSKGFESAYGDDAHTIVNHLIAHAQKMRYRIAVIDCGDDQTVAEVRAMRAQFDTTYAALYYPWVTILDPVTGLENEMPPSGFVAGIYARNDVMRAVYKAPANEVVTLALGFERLLSKGQQEVLNPEGINCFRYFAGRGYRLWGARTMTSDPEWKYVNLRRYFAFLEHSVDRGTQWAVFEPNGEALWANVRRTIEDFLFDQWQNGALLGDKPEKAFFVRCDRSTMTQNDLDNGRLVCLIGVAPLRPAEFVIFRIGQWTADRKG
jgi:phage tail sheath protein FI